MKTKKTKKTKIAVGTLLFLLLGTLAFIIGSIIAGWDIWSWFISPQAFLIYAVVGLGVLFLVWIILTERFNKDE